MLLECYRVPSFWEKVTNVVGKKCVKETEKKIRKRAKNTTKAETLLCFPFLAGRVEAPLIRKGVKAASLFCYGA